MENESRLKRLYWSATATVIAAAIWLPSPVGEIFFFPRQQLFQDKILFGMSFLFALCIALFFLGQSVRNNNLLLVLGTAALGGIAVSSSLLTAELIHYCYTTGKWLTLSSSAEIYITIELAIWTSILRGTFALAAFTALVYRYLRKLVDHIRSKYRSRQTEGATRGE